MGAISFSTNDGHVPLILLKDYFYKYFDNQMVVLMFG